MGADFAVPFADGDGKLRVEQSQVEALEADCDRFNEQLEPLKSFVLPGGTEAAARLHLARTGLPARGAHCARGRACQPAGAPRT